MPVASLVVRIAADIAEFESNLASAERSLQKTGNNLEKIGTQLTKGLTLPIVAIGGLAAKAAIDFEDSFAGVRKTVDATDQEFAKLEEQFREMAKTMPLTVNEINKVAEAAGQLGVRKEDIASFTETMIKLGAATNLTADEAATGMQKFANALGQPQINMEQLGSSLVDLGNHGAATEKQILDMAGNIAGTGAQIRLTAGEIFGMSNALVGVSIDAEKGGTAISRLFKDIEKAAEQGGTSLKEFAKVADLSTEGFSKLFREDSAAVITKFIEGLGKLKAEGVSLNTVLDKLGITETRYADTVKLAANASDQFAESVRRGNAAFNEGKALDKEYQERLKTTASQLTILKNNLTDVAITLGQAMLPAINDIVRGAKPFLEIFSDLAQKFKELPDPIRNVTLGFIALLAAAGPVVFIASQVVKAWASLLAIARFLPVAIGAVSTAFIAVAGAMGATTTGLTGITGAMVLLRGTAVALASSLGAIPAALLAILAALPKAKQGLDNFNAAVQTGTLWDMITTKDAPAIWEKEFWGWGNGLNNAAAGATAFSKAGGIMAAEFVPGIKAIKDEISGNNLADKVRDLGNAFAELDPAAQRSAFTIKSVGAQALALRDAGATLSPELDKLANQHLKSLARESKAAASELKQLAEEEKREALKSLGDDIKFVEERVIDIGVAFEKAEIATQEMNDDLFATRDAILSVDEAMTKTSEAFELDDERESLKSLRADIEAVADAVETPPDMSKWEERFEELRDRLKDIGLNGAHIFAEGIAEGIRTGDWSAAGQAFEDAMGQVMSDGMAAAVDFIVPGLGRALQPIFDAISEKITGAFDFNEGRDLVQDFAKSFGGFDALHKRLLELGDAGEALWKKLTQGVGRDNPEQARAAIDAINQALGVQSTRLQNAQAVLNEYGITFEQTGQKFRNSTIASAFDVLFEKTQTLKEIGVDYSLILEKQAEQFSELTKKAIETGTEIPASMRPVLEQLRDMGLLTDKATGEFIDLGQVSWAKSLTQGFDQVTKAIYDLRDALTKGVGGALDDLGQRQVRIPIRFDVDDVTLPGGASVPALASGGIVRRPTLALVGESGPEAVVPLSQLGSVGGSGLSTVIFEIDGRQIAAATVPYLPGEVRRYIPA